MSPPPDLATLDLAVRTQFDELWDDLERPRRHNNSGSAAAGRAWGRLGQWFDVYGYDDSAAGCYFNAQRLDPSEPRWPYYRGLVESTAGRFDEAEECLVAAAALAPTEPAPRVRLADIALSQNQLDLAERRYHEVLENHPREAGALMGIARLELERGHPRQALEPLTVLLEQQPDATEVHAMAARALRLSGKLELAAAHLERIPEDNFERVPLVRDDPWELELEKMDRGARTFTRRAVRASRRGELGHAVTLFARAVRADPSGPEKRVNLGLALRQVGRWDEAQRQLEESVQLAEESSELAAKAHLELGRLLAARGSGDDARRHLATSLAIDPHSTAAHVELGRLAHNLGDLEAALEHYRWVRSRGGEVGTTRFWHAAVLVGLGRTDDAIRALEVDLAELGADRQLELLLARLLSTATKPDLRALDRATQLVDRWQVAPDVFFAETAAMVASARGQRDRAVAWQRAAVEALDNLKPRSLAHTARRRLVLYSRGDPCGQPWEERERPVDAPVDRP